MEKSTKKQYIRGKCINLFLRERLQIVSDRRKSADDKTQNQGDRGHADEE